MQCSVLKIHFRISFFKYLSIQVSLLQSQVTFDVIDTLFLQLNQNATTDCQHILNIKSYLLQFHTQNIWTKWQSVIAFWFNWRNNASISLKITCNDRADLPHKCLPQKITINRLNCCWFNRKRFWDSCSFVLFWPWHQYESETGKWYKFIVVVCKPMQCSVLTKGRAMQTWLEKLVS